MGMKKGDKHLPVEKVKPTPICMGCARRSFYNKKPSLCYDCMEFNEDPIVTSINDQEGVIALMAKKAKEA